MATTAATPTAATVAEANRLNPYYLHLFNNTRQVQTLILLNGALAKQWDMVNFMIIGWIYISVESKLHPSISLVDSAKDMWASLKRRFNVTDATHTYQLHADITVCKQEGETVEIYFA